ncbi:hypothetical protein BDW62DRAFT_180241 [Aspergillus aurantiobrunneus]
MASNREERLQMRQRGAGTRKIKEVDFGFSLGFGPPVEGSSQPIPQPTNREPDPALVSEPPSLDAPPRRSDGTTTTEPLQPTLSPTRVIASAQNHPIQRTPGSARNKLPPRPSTFDIPAEEEPELERTSKRRKIEPPREISPSNGTQTETQEIDASHNGIVEELTVPPVGENTEIPIQTGNSKRTQLLNQETPAEVPSIPTIETNKALPESSGKEFERSETGNAEQRAPEPPRVNGTGSPPSDTTKGKGKRRGKRRRLSPPQSVTSKIEAAQPTDIQSKDSPQLPGPTEATQAQESNEPGFPKTQEKRTRNRTPAPVQASENTVVADEAPAEDARSVSVPSGTTDKGLRERTAFPGRGSNETSAVQVTSEVAPNDITTREPSVPSQNRRNKIEKGKKRAEEPSVLTSRSPDRSGENRIGKRKRLREEREQERDRQAEANSEQERSGSDTLRAGKRRKGGKEGEPREAIPGHEEGPEPEVEQIRTEKRRMRREKGNPIPQDRQPDPDAEAESSRIRKGKQRELQQPALEQEQPEREPAVEPESRPKGEPPKSTKGRRGKRPTTQPDEPPQDETSEERLQTTKRKTRQPRGETVPVTVHRLANAASLGGDLLESAREDDADSPDVVANNQTTKLSSRGGVNAADVLAQICRETLEKTLMTLKNGIANEANTARRAEWALRKKAVEAFGAELEGHLFDLSEMLDSNFMLSAKVKKAKRNMMERRTRLDHVRREREAIALRMDAVRREHSREEHARKARSAINHSLHNLDLAVERGQARATTQKESLTAGLEFRLRNMAQNVGSTAPGCQGGILNQIRMFNAQLEATARQLEG